MKLSKFLVGVAIYMLATFLLVSCQKDQSINQTTDPTLQNNKRMGGVVEDDPAVVAKVPMIISSDFLKNNKDFTPPSSLFARVRRDATPPTASITSPTNSASVSGTIYVNASASDNVSVTMVSFYVDGGLVTSNTASPYTFTWNSASKPNGNHTLMVTAKDAAGNATSSSVSVSVNNIAAGDITAPTVSITSPTNGASVTGTISVSASAGDNVGVSAVTFSVDGATIGTDNTSPYSISWNSASVANGAHNVTARAADAAGNAATSTISVTVNTVVIPPTTIPASFQLITPPVGNQGNEGNCSGFAIGYAARSIEQYYSTNATSYNNSVNVFSPEFVYNLSNPGDCASGTSISIILNIIKNQGICTWQSMPYSDINGCALQPSSSQLLNATSYKINSYVTIPNSDQVAIKTMVSSKHPVITTVIADNGFVNAGPGFVWNSNSGSGALAHILIICGYDDSKHAYKIMNSWGTTWGDAGFTWIDYSYFPQISSYYTYAIQ